MPTAQNDEKEFFPKGAVAFFAILTAFFAAIWLALYAVTIRHQ